MADIQKFEARLERAELFMLKVSEYVLSGISESDTLDYFYDMVSELYAELGEDD